IESGSNDPMAIFLTVALLDVLLAGRTELEPAILVQLAKQFGIGAVLGLGGARLLVWLINRLKLITGLYPLLALADGGSVAAAVELASPAEHVRVQVVNLAGDVVRTLDLGAQGAGLARFAWDGKADSGATAPAGTYQFVAQATAAGGAQSAAQVLVSAPVESVTIGGGQGGLTLTLQGLGEVPFSAVRQIG
ncbi:MAG TPA: FlgD immunoglobulin-like domain containing protein, partial [Solirubrobacteraceae bacterium]|nr:FlgD immunoglobulin-like domain containing protein [Solirubrobacteraceae bacterium]